MDKIPKAPEKKDLKDTISLGSIQQTCSAISKSFDGYDWDMKRDLVKKVFDNIIIDSGLVSHVEWQDTLGRGGAAITKNLQSHPHSSWLAGEPAPTPRGRKVTIPRAATSLCYPARFMLAAALNPCPCGYYTDPRNKCTCSPQQIQKYMSRISGPLLDRIDIHVEVPALSYEELAQKKPGEDSASMRRKVAAARLRQTSRFAGEKKIFCNAHMESRHVRKYCVAARPSGTEDIYKIYAESFRGQDALRQILTEAQATVDAVIRQP